MDSLSLPEALVTNMTGKVQVLFIMLSTKQAPFFMPLAKQGANAQPTTLKADTSHRAML